MKTLICFVVLVASSLSACAADEWKHDDTVRESLYLAISALDWAQTRNIARNPTKWQEENLILGEHPSVDRVDAYFVITSLAHVGIAALLPQNQRHAFQYVSIGIEASCVSHNLSIGIGIKF